MNTTDQERALKLATDETLSKALAADDVTRQ